MSACRSCGHNDGVAANEQPPEADHCGHCPPWQCEYCGEMCSATDLCPCWASLEGLALADQKALLAKGGLSLDPRQQE